MSARRTLWCEHALLPEGHRCGVRLGIDAAGQQKLRDVFLTR